MGAIETRYRGHLFRSRIEARWAAFFDLLDWGWIYEPDDAQGYIPDFRLRGEGSVLVEVKAARTLAELQDVAEANLPKLNPADEDYLVVGSDPFPRVTDSAISNLDVVIGVLIEREGGGASLGRGMWHRCGGCGRYAFHHEFMSYASRPCGHYDGDHLLISADADDLHRFWGEAHELTRWSP